MKTEEIAENAREYAEQINRLSDAHSDNTICPITPKELKRCTAEYFIKGYEACNAEWQEKVRWKSVDEKLPEINRKVEIKYTTGSMSPSTLIQIGYLKENGKFTGEMDWVYATHWREIIE